MSVDLDEKLRLGFLIHDVSRLRRVALDRALQPLGVTRSQWWVLAFLSREDGMSQVALAADLGLGKVALGGLVDRLEVSGLIERRPDATDRRLKRIFMTIEGRSLIRNVRACVVEAESDILVGIADDELQLMSGALRRMKKNLLGILNLATDEKDDIVSPAPD